MNQPTLSKRHLGRDLCGHGSLRNEATGIKIPVERFDLGRATDGRILLSVRGDGSDLKEVIGRTRAPFTLTGESRDGRACVTAQGCTWLGSRMGAAENSIARADFWSADVDVLPVLASAEPACKANAYITNFWVVQRDSCEVVVGRFRGRFRSLVEPWGRGYDLIAPLGGATAELELASSDLAHVAASEMEAVLDDVCLCLSVLTGTRVDWSEVRLATASRRVIARRLVSARAPGQPREWRILQPKVRLDSYLATAYDAIQLAHIRWRLGDAVKAYLDGLAEGDSLELRGLKIASCLEVLVGAYMRTNRTQYILDPDFFAKRLLPTAEKALELAFESMAGFEKDRMQLLLPHLRGMNRYPWRRGLRESLRCLGLSDLETTVSRAVDTRNDLVHSASFQWLGRSGPRYSREDQFEFISGLAGRMLLATLGVPGAWMNPMPNSCPPAGAVPAGQP